MAGLGEMNLAAVIGLVVVLSMIPLIVISVTAFAKIAVVLFIVRNALGIQQTPPNLLMYAITIILTGYIMYPTLVNLYGIVTDPTANYTSYKGIERVVVSATEPVKAFLIQHSHERERVFFVQATERVWRGSGQATPASTDLVVLVPAFLSSELTRAFEIGFLLYLPFLMIDFAVSAILIALGMQMMAPNIISTPLKLLLFVLVDGWSRLLQGLILSYG